ncbi:alpha-2-macroglobulin [Microcoleus sp. N3A4]|uniref:alpha-2-macroglobulin n=1 Tax=Microcoleus sp. N3A4 TaxID=3055379 RepID=UPI002FD1115C
MKLKKWIIAVLVFTLALAITTCGVTNKSSKIEPLPSVAPLISPQLVDWIEEISPTGKAEPLNQIRIRFKEALIPVESLDSSEQQGKIKLFEIQPAIPGQFRFLTPRMVGFQPEQALPKATRIQIAIKAGLTDLKNHRIEKDLAWTFNTEPIQLSNLPTSQAENSEFQPIELKPTLKFTSNVELDLASVQEHLKLMPEGQTKTVPLKVELAKSEAKSKERQTPEEKLDPSVRTLNYTIVPQQTLEKATQYRLQFDSGLLPLHGNLPSETPFVSQVQTYSPLAFKAINFFGQPDAGGAYGRFVKGSGQLQFNNGIVADSARENITVNPPPKKSPTLVQAYDNEPLISLNPWSLEPAQKYTITIGANLKDKFGQTLGKPVTLQYETGDVSGEIWTPTGLNIFPAGKDLQLNISTVNLPKSQYKAAYKVVQPTDLVYNADADPSGGENDLLSNPSEWQTFRISGKKNQTNDITVPLREKLGSATGMLAYGVQARTNLYSDEKGKQQWREPANYGLVQLTNLGVFTQWFPESGLIRVHHLDDGSPVAASVEIYESQLEAKSRPQPTPCATGKTHNNGALLLSRENLQKCIKSRSGGFEKAPKLLVIARENKDWAFARTEEYSGAYGYGIEGDTWNSNKPQSRGTIFSDRQLYQPGEKAWFTGTAYYLQNGVIKQDKNASYTVKLQTPSGTKTDLGTQKTNEFGTFSLELPIESNQPLGYYSILAKGTSGAEISGQFRIAEFKPPNFKVDLNLDKEFALIDDKIEANAQSNYLFGSPVEGGKAKYYVTRRQAEFTPKGWEQFAFGRQWFWPEESPNVPTDVLQQNSVLDASGKGNQIFTVGKDLPYPMNYRVDVEVSDVSNLSVSDSKTFTALPSNRLIGLQTNFVADAGKPLPIQLIVTDPTGKLLEGQKIRVELQKINYSSVTQVVEGSRNSLNQIEYKTVAKTEVQSGSNPQTISLNPPESGSYRIRANFVDVNNEVTATDLQIWATGENVVNWGNRYDNNRLEVKLDKKNYQPGETATALIQSPYPEAELYFAVVRDKTLYQTVTKVKGGAPQIQFQVTPEMLPNAAVEAVLFRQGKSLKELEPGSLEQLVKIGFAPFQTSLDAKYLKVQVTPQKKELQPGAEETIQLQLQDNRGKPIKGQFTVMVVNEAVLQLTGYRPPDLVKTVYAEQSISTRFNDNRQNVVLENMASPLAKGWGYGGGFSTGAANTRVRKDFQALAYYNGSVVTDINGKASVKFKLPDDLTTWRVMAVATDGNLDFGKGEATFITTKSLISHPILPQFARPGDRIQAGLSVTNNTQQKGDLTINGQVAGAVKFEGNNPAAANLKTQAESGTHAYRFPLIAGSDGDAKVQFATQLNGNVDAFEVPLEVKPLEVTENVVETGTIPPNLPLQRGGQQVKIPLKIDKNVVSDVGGLEISLASTLIPEIIAPAKQVLQDEQLPFLEPIASQLLIAANLQTLYQKYAQSLKDFNPSKAAAIALEKLSKLQQSDGGFASYPGQVQSDPFLTPYTASAIASASKAFPNTVNAGMQSRLTDYLKKTLADPGQYEFCQKQICKNQVRLSSLIALAKLGEKRNDFLADIYQQRSEYNLVTQIELARYLSQFKDWQDESKLLSDELQKNIYITGRTATVNLPQNVSWIASPTAIQSQALRLFIAQKSKAEDIDRLLQSLLNLRRHGTWQSTYDNSEALAALVDYSETQPTPPKFQATVKLAGKTLDSIQFDGYRNPSQFIIVATDQLPRNGDLIVEKSGQGTLHYVVNYGYRLQGNQPGRLNGLRVVREIRPAGEDKVLGKQQLSIPQPLTLGVGQVFDIGLGIIADSPVDHVVITDQLPAGLEAIDNSFQTSTKAVEAQGDSWQIGYKTMYGDRVVAYSDRLEPGAYSLHYLVRSVTPGTYLWPGAEAHLQYAPEEFGRSASSTLIVSDN